MSEKLQQTVDQFQTGNLNESIQASTDLMQFGEVAVEPLIAIIQDGDQSDLWWLATQTLGYIHDKRAVEPLITLLRNPLSHHAALARKYTAYALAQLPDPRAVDVLIEMLHEEKYQDEDDEFDYNQQDDETIEAAVGALASIGDWRGIQAVIERFLEGDFWCDCHMGEWGGEQAFQYILEQTKTDNSERRSRAVSLLGEFGDKRAVDLLIELMKNDSDDHVRHSAVYGLSILGDPRAFIPAIQALQDQYEQVRLHAMFTIRYFLIGLYKPTSAEPSTKSIFDEAVHVLGEQALMDGLLNAIDDNFLPVSLSSLECLRSWSLLVRQEIIQERILPRLRELTSHSNKLISDSASSILEQILLSAN